MQNVPAFEFSPLRSPVHTWLRAVQLGVWAAASPAEEADAETPGYLYLPSLQAPST